jgi:hypothetical protein
MMPLKATNALIAIVVSLLTLPALKALDHLNRGCGDGLCGFFSGLLVLGALAVATLIFMRRSARRQETPAVLRWVPVALWMLAFVPLFT